MYYKSDKSNVEADTLSQIARDQVIQPDAVKAIMNAMVEQPEAFGKTYAWSARTRETIKLNPSGESRKDDSYELGRT